MVQIHTHAGMCGMCGYLLTYLLEPGCVHHLLVVWQPCTIALWCKTEWVRRSKAAEILKSIVVIDVT